MNKNITTLKDNYGTAYENYKKGNFKAAEKICYKILSIDPNFFQSKLLLANIARQNRDFIKAKKLLDEVIDTQPNNISALNNLGTVNKELGEIKNAVNFYKKVIEIDPNNTNAHYNLGAICYDLKKFNEAKNYLKKSVDIQPNFALPFFVLGNVHAHLKEYKDAVINYKKAIELNSNLVNAYNNLGLVFRNLNDFENAISYYQKAIKIKADHVNSHHNLALALKETGKFDESIKSHEKAIKYEPENLGHYFYLSNLKKDILNVNLKNEIEKIIKKKNSSKHNLAYGYFLLSKYEQKAKNYEKEINYLKKAHHSFFELNKTKFEIIIKYNFNDMLQIAKEVTVEKLAKENEIKPIFIIGVPRCGSTLVEKIIGSGKKFVAMGEETSILEEFVTAKILKIKSLNLGDAENIRNEIIDIYKKKGLISEKYNYTFTDKSLNNFFFLKIIKKIFPNAKIINCKRDPFSSIISIFQNNLTELAWAHDLKNIFEYFNNCFQTIDNYKGIDSNFVYDLYYEKLVNNPKEESIKLMKFCELPWDQKCLEFYKRKDLISKTASNIQIRSAIYKQAVEKYIPYRKFLNEYGKKYSWFN